MEQQTPNPAPGGGVMGLSTPQISQERDEGGEEPSQPSQASQTPTQQQEQRQRQQPRPRRVMRAADASSESSLSASEGEAASDEDERRPRQRQRQRQGQGQRGRGPNFDADESDDSNDDAPEDSDSEGEDLLETAFEDYKRVEELDKYDDAEFDEGAYGGIEGEDRLRAERELDERDAKRRRWAEQRGPYSLFAEEEEDESDLEEDAAVRAKRRRKARDRGAPRRRGRGMGGDGGGGDGDEDADGGASDEEEDEPLPVDLENFDPTDAETVAEFIRRPEISAELKRRFASFLQTYEEPTDSSTTANANANAEPIYPGLIQDMCASNSQSLHVSFVHLSRTDPKMAVWVVDAPKAMFDLFNEVAMKEVLRLFPRYEKIHSSVYVRITELPAAFSDRLRDLRCRNINELVRVSGVVTRRTTVLPRLKEVRYKCPQCAESIGPYAHNAEPPSACAFCGYEARGRGGGGGGGAFRLDSERTVYNNYQRITLQESPGTVPAGRVPRQKDVVLLGDLIDSARPGEEVEITGVLVSCFDMGLNAQNGFPVFSTVIEANLVQKREDVLSSLRVTEHEKQRFREMAKNPRIVERIVGSVAPSIYGNDFAKTAVALAMFGGREKNVDNKHHVRGDINVLLLGDPGTAKSQVLKYVERTAPRAVFTTGKGASAVGLTASVHKDAVTKEWTLEGGALVLADRGVCLIDEFDKMNDKDRTSIHEAMEQQSISISKAGIVTTLRARCSVIAAANPIGGRYDPQRSFPENVELTDPILQRFDVLCVLQDVVDPEADARLAKFVVSSHVRSHRAALGASAASSPLPADPTVFDESRPVRNVFEDHARHLAPRDGLIDQNTLRKYISYARSLKPQLVESETDTAKFVSVYAKLRKESDTTGGLPIGVRHVEAMIRVSEAFARMHLREYVSSDDVDRAIRVCIESFTQAQRFSARRALTKSLAKFITFDRDNDDLLLFLLEELARDHARLLRVTDSEVTVNVDELTRRAKEYGVERFVPSFLDSDKFRESRFRRKGASQLVRSV